MPTPIAVTASSLVIAVPAGEVAGASADLAGQQASHLTQVGGNAHVDHHDLSPCLGCKRIDDGATRQEVANHLTGDLLRPRRDPLRVDTVIAGENRDRGRLRQRRRAAAGQPGKLDRDIFEDAKRANRLGQLGLALPRRDDSIAVERSHSRGDLVKQAHCRTARKLALAVLLGVHSPAERAPAGPACQLELRLRREAGHVTDAQIRDDFQVRRQAEFGGKLALAEEADPADT